MTPTEFTKIFSFITSDEPNLSHHVLQLLCYSVIPLPRKHVSPSRWLAMDLRICSLLRERVFGESLVRNGLPLCLHYSGFQASCHNTISCICTYSFTNLTENVRLSIYWYLYHFSSYLLCLTVFSVVWTSLLNLYFNAPDNLSTRRVRDRTPYGSLYSELLLIRLKVDVVK
jgi:hypothetical protein